MQTSTSRHRTVLADMLRLQGRRHGWVAHQIGISDASFSLMLKGERRCSRQQADAIGLLLAVPTEAFYRDGEFVIATQISDSRPTEVPA